eukprot:6180425-Pleurochrysis_carterae.AAC.1
MIFSTTALVALLVLGVAQALICTALAVSCTTFILCNALTRSRVEDHFRCTRATERQASSRCRERVSQPLLGAYLSACMHRHAQFSVETCERAFAQVFYASSRSVPVLLLQKNATRPELSLAKKAVYHLFLRHALSKMDVLSMHIKRRQGGESQQGRRHQGQRRGNENRGST